MPNTRRIPQLSQGYMEWLVRTFVGKFVDAARFFGDTDLYCCATLFGSLVRSSERIGAAFLVSNRKQRLEPACSIEIKPKESQLR